MVLLTTVKVPSVQMPPPLAAELPENVESSMTALPALNRPPPASWLAELSARVESVRVSVPWL